MVLRDEQRHPEWNRIDTAVCSYSTRLRGAGACSGPLGETYCSTGVMAQCCDVYARRGDEYEEKSHTPE